MENFINEDSIKLPESNNRKEKEYSGTIECPKMEPKEKYRKNLDKFIQDCLDKYKPVENPDESLYENTTEDEKDFIISRKSTIPDLVIWNKPFNKNDCFYGLKTKENYTFPRFTFYLRLNKDKNGKNKNNKKEKKNKKNKKNKKKDKANNNEKDTKELKHEIELLGANETNKFYDGSPKKYKIYNYLKRKNMKLENKTKLDELKYLICIKDQQKKINELENKLKLLILENSKELKESKCFPNISKFNLKQHINPKSIPLAKSILKNTSSPKRNLSKIPSVKRDYFLTITNSCTKNLFKMRNYKENIENKENIEKKEKEKGKKFKEKQQLL